MSEVDLISFSSLVFISKTKRSSSEFVDLAAAYLENITSTLRTILSGSINMARVLASLASRETFISPFQRILIQKVFRKVESNNFLSGACGQSAPDKFTTAQRMVALKPPPSKKHKHNANAAHALRPLLTKGRE